MRVNIRRQSSYSEDVLDRLDETLVLLRQLVNKECLKMSTYDNANKASSHPRTMITDDDKALLSVLHSLGVAWMSMDLVSSTETPTIDLWSERPCLCFGDTIYDCRDSDGWLTSAPKQMFSFMEEGDLFDLETLEFD